MYPFHLQVSPSDNASPRYKGAGCQQKKMFVCEYYLSDDQAEMTVPSYVNTCDEILVLAGLANEILENSQNYRRVNVIC